jgi:hypothetical protein
MVDARGDMPQLTSGRSGRVLTAATIPARVLTTLVVAGIVVGVLAALALDPAPEFPYTARTLILAGGTTAQQRSTLRTVREIAEDPGTEDMAREQADLAGKTGPITTSVNLRAGMVVVEGRAATRTAAIILASSPARVATTFVRRVRLGKPGIGLIPVSDFAEGSSSWEQESSFNRPPTVVSLNRGFGRYDQTSLRVLCTGGPGCGPATHIPWPVEDGRVYTASLWARSPRQGVEVSIVLGSGAPQISPGQATRLGPRWRRLAVSWRAPSRAERIELGLQDVRGGRAVFDLDAATVREGAPPPTPALERLAFSRRDVAVPGPATVRSDFGGTTPLAVLAGAIAGGLVGLAAFGAWTAARRRQT